MKPTIAALFGVIAVACAFTPPVPDDIVKKFKEQSQVKDEVELKIQEIFKDLPFVFDGREIPFGDEDLDVIKVFTLDAKVVVDGASQTPVSRVFASKKDLDILIVKDTNGKLVAATKNDKNTGKFTEVTLISKGGNAYATVTSDDLDDEKLALFGLEDIMPPDEARRLRAPRQVHDFIDAPKHLTIDDDHRSLQESCDSFDVIKVAIVVDSSLCAYAGGSSEVITLSQKIVADTSKLYEVPGLCKKLQISYLEIHCDPNTDPIKPYLSQAGNSKNVCGNLLDKFVGYVRSTGINSDVAHLFHGKDFTGTSAIGCAFVGTLCRTDGFNSGVNEISFSNLPALQSKLVAHENGHICNANHVKARSDVMFDSICGSCNSGFGQTSKNSINSKVDSTSCTSVENVPTLSPSSSPTASPIAAPTVTPTQPAPTESPVEASGILGCLFCTSVENVPTLSPVSSPTASPSAVPVVNPTPPAPTKSPVGGLGCLFFC
jgi:hypothetical protein